MSNSPEQPAPTKACVRTEMRETLASMSVDDRHRASDAACLRLNGLEVFRQASVIMMYMAISTEVDTTTAALRCFQRGKTVCVPRVDWERRDMNAIEVDSFDDHCMEIDDHGIRTPRAGQLIVRRSIDLVVVPGLAFDAQGHRLGRGGGFYDRFLSRLRRDAITVGLCFDRQIIDQVPVDERDMNVDFVVSERRATACCSRSHR